MYNVKRLRPEVRSFTEVILACAEALKRLMEEFPNYKKSKIFNDLINDVLKLEEKCDEIYIKSVRDLFVNEKIQPQSMFGAIYSIAGTMLRCLWKSIEHRGSSYMKNL